MKLHYTTQSRLESGYFSMYGEGTGQKVGGQCDLKNVFKTTDTNSHIILSVMAESKRHRNDVVIVLEHQTGDEEENRVIFKDDRYDSDSYIWTSLSSPYVFNTENDALLATCSYQKEQDQDRPVRCFIHMYIYPPPELVPEKEFCSLEAPKAHKKDL